METEDPLARLASIVSGSWVAQDTKSSDPTQGQRDLYTQLIISSLLGLGAFLCFCFLRPRWTTLYAARKQQSHRAASLPELPDSLFGWVLTLYKITDQEVLRSTGLDAYVFLEFFRMTIKFLVGALLAVFIIMVPVQYHFHGDVPSFPGNGTKDGILHLRRDASGNWSSGMNGALQTDGNDETPAGYPPGYFWMHVVFVYAFSALAFYLLDEQTKKIIKVRQEYLGRQSTVTDRTLRLSGIPKELQSEHRLTELIEKLGIGKVESITLCRDWSELDGLMDERADVLRRLEEAWAVNLKPRRVERNLETLPIAQPPPPHPLPAQNSDDEDASLLGEDAENRGPTKPYIRNRPTTRIHYGFLKLKSKRVDAIDYYEEKLRQLDGKIENARRKECAPSPLAFVTMDSTAACQMAMQAILDPSPSRLIAQVAPPPSDVVWRNTYKSRIKRMTRAWLITAFVTLLAVFWSVPLLALAGLLDINSIRKVLPGLVKVLDRHKFLRSLVQTGLPTLVISLLTVAVPYLYDWLSNMQGMISQSDVELSVISKNFFFTFFNLFFLYTVLGSATNLLVLLKESLNHSDYITNQLAMQLERFGQFYANLIILQGLGLLPLRLLEFGSVTLYPITLMGAKTPRDFAELVQPPEFKYGFYLPQTLLIFIICIVYSVLPQGPFILLFGLIYFIIGFFTYKYQLLYAMEHNQHSTGKLWPVISYRVMLGIGTFHLAMIGWLALKGAITASAVIVPLFFWTIWYSYFFARTYQPLVNFIALSSIRRNSTSQHPTEAALEENVWRVDSDDHDQDEGPTVDESREKGMTYTNPSLTVPLEAAWTTKKRMDNAADQDDLESGGSTGEAHRY